MTNLKREETAWLQLREIYKCYGYKNHRMSKFEEYLFYAKNMKFLESDQIITFTNPDGKLMALKPDVALSIVKNTKATKTAPEKLFYNESVYRVSKQSGQFREISQIGLEYIGEVTRYATVEVVNLALKSLEAIEEDYILNISHMGYMNAFLDSVEADFLLRQNLLSCLSRKNRSELDKVLEDTGLAGGSKAHFKELIGVSGKLPDCLHKVKELAINEAMRETADELQDICNALGVRSERIILDFSLVNETGYYNGVLFHGFVKNVPRAVLKGGRYDNLLARMDKAELQAIGFAVYFDGLDRYLKAPQEVGADTIVLYDDDSDLALLHKTVERFAETGETVRAARNLPHDCRHKRILKVEKNTVTEVNYID